MPTSRMYVNCPGVMYAFPMASRRRRICLVIGPIRAWSDDLVRCVIEPAVKPLDYVVVRADSILIPGMIVWQIAVLLDKADLVVADLSDENPNVFYEIGVRHEKGKPIVNVARAGESLPFDNAGMRTIFVDLANSDSVANAVLNVRRAAVSALHAPVITPVSRSDPERGDDFVQALIDSATDGASIHPLVPTRYLIEIAPDVDESIDALSEIGMERLVLLLERLASGTVVGSHVDGASDPLSYAVSTSQLGIAASDIVAITAYYTSSGDRIVIRRVETKRN